MTSSHDEYATLCDASPDALITVDAAGTVQYANARIEPLFGYASDEVVGQPVELLLPEGDRSTHVDQRDAYLEAPTTRPMGVDIDLKGRRKDGTVFPVDVSLSPMTVGDATEVVAAIRDISDRKAFQQQYRTLLETAPDAVFVADVETGRLVEVNEAATALLGYPERELRSMSQTDIHPEGEATRYQEFFEWHLASEQTVFSRFPDGSELEVETAAGERVPVEINATLLDHDDRRLAIGIFRDVTARRTHEQELERQVERIESLARIIAHDVRNPLQVADGYLELARETGDLDQLEHVANANDRMRSIIDDALMMIREGRAANPEEMEVVDLSTFVRDCWRNVETADATLEVSVDGRVDAIRSRLCHLFENLYRNAVEHGGPDVTVTVGTLADRPGFYVEDDGPGIAAADREHVFDVGHTTRTDGSGFGLNIVKEVAEGHGWTVSVSDATRGGARFDLTGPELA